MLSYLYYSCSEEQRGKLQRRLTLPTPLVCLRFNDRYKVISTVSSHADLYIMKDGGNIRGGGGRRRRTERDLSQTGSQSYRHSRWVASKQQSGQKTKPSTRGLPKTITPVWTSPVAKWHEQLVWRWCSPTHHPPPPRKTPLPPPPYTTCLLWRRFSQVSNLGDSVSLSYWLHQLW